jgi:hypothetical protein
MAQPRKPKLPARLTVNVQTKKARRKLLAFFFVAPYPAIDIELL